MRRMFISVIFNHLEIKWSRALVGGGGPCCPPYVASISEAYQDSCASSTIMPGRVEGSVYSVILRAYVGVVHITSVPISLTRTQSCNCICNRGQEKQAFMLNGHVSSDTSSIKRKSGY